MRISSPATFGRLGRAPRRFTEFGQYQVWPDFVLKVGFFLEGPGVWVGLVRVGVRVGVREGGGPSGARRAGAQKGGGPEGWGLEGWEFPKSPRTPNVHIRGSQRLKNNQNSTRRPPREGRKKENCGGRGKKSAKFWAVWRRAVPQRAVRGRADRRRAVRVKEVRVGALRVVWWGLECHNSGHSKCTGQFGHTSSGQSWFGQSWP